MAKRKQPLKARHRRKRGAHPAARHSSNGTNRLVADRASREHERTPPFEWQPNCPEAAHGDGGDPDGHSPGGDRGDCIHRGDGRASASKVWFLCLLAACTSCPTGPLSSSVLVAPAALPLPPSLASEGTPCWLPAAPLASQVSRSRGPTSLQAEKAEVAQDGAGGVDGWCFCTTFNYCRWVARLGLSWAAERVACLGIACLGQALAVTCHFGRVLLLALPLGGCGLPDSGPGVREARVGAGDGPDLHHVLRLGHGCSGMGADPSCRPGTSWCGVAHHFRQHGRDRQGLPTLPEGELARQVLLWRRQRVGVLSSFGTRCLGSRTRGALSSSPLRCTQQGVPVVLQGVHGRFRAALHSLVEAPLHAAHPYHLIASHLDSPPHTYTHTHTHTRARQPSGWAATWALRTRIV